MVDVLTYSNKQLYND